MKRVLVISDERAVYRALERPDSVVIPADACNVLQGFVPDTFTEYRNRSVFRDSLYRDTQTPSSAVVSNTFAGRYYLAVAMQDSPSGDEPFELWLGNRKLADVVASDNDSRVHLYVLREPLDLKQGEIFRLVTGANSHPYRIEALALLKRLPAPAARPAVPRAPRVPRPERRPGTRLRTVPLIIPAQPGAPADRYPLTVGVPLPMGDLYDCARVGLVDASGQELALQARVTGRWPDGSVRWLLLDFQHSLDNHDRQVCLRYGTEVPRLRPPRPLAVQDEHGITVDTGAATLRLETSDLTLPGKVRLAGAAGASLLPAPGGGIQLVAEDGRVFRSRGALERLEIEDNGPLRAVLRADCGHYDEVGNRLFRSTARIHAYAGKSWFRVAYMFVNDNTELSFTSLRELRLLTPLAGEPPRETRVLQDMENRFTVTSAGQVVRTGQRAAGLLMEHCPGVAVTSPVRCAENASEIPATASPLRTAFAGDCRTAAHTRLPRQSSMVGTVCAVAVRDFWQNYPKSLAIGPDGLEVGVCPDVSATDYQVGGYEEDRLYYYLSGGHYRLKQGMARTHDLFYGVAPVEDAGELRAQARAFQSNPAVRAKPEVYLRSGAVGEVALRSSGTAQYDRWTDHALQRYLADQRRNRARGMLNWGDWFGERRYNWGNMEYDTPWAFLIEYLRGGSAKWWELAVRAAQHLMDVDTCHAAAEAWRIGGQWYHCMGHVGGYYPEGEREGAIADAGMAPSHTWVEGLFLYHALTGEAQALEAARAACDWVAATVDPRSYDFDNCREPGWSLIHLCAGYRATLEQRYLEAAHIIVERVLERQRGSGGWERLMVPGHCYCDPPRHKGNAAFMVGVLMAGLRRYHQITGDRRVRRCLIRAADYVVRSYWLPDRKVFRYTNCPYIWADVDMNPQMIEGLGYAWRLSRSPDIARVLVEAVDRCYDPALADPERDGRPCVAVPGYPVRVFRVEDEGVGKTVSLWMRQAPFALRDYLGARAQLEES